MTAKIIEVKRARSHNGITKPTKWLRFNSPENLCAEVNPASVGTWVYKIDNVVYTELTDEFLAAVDKVRTWNKLQGQK